MGPCWTEDGRSQNLSPVSKLRCVPGQMLIHPRALSPIRHLKVNGNFEQEDLRGILTPYGEGGQAEPRGLLWKLPSLCQELCAASSWYGCVEVPLPSRLSSSLSSPQQALRTVPTQGLCSLCHCWSLDAKELPSGNECHLSTSPFKEFGFWRVFQAAPLRCCLLHQPVFSCYLSLRLPFPIYQPQSPQITLLPALGLHNDLS